MMREIKPREIMEKFKEQIDKKRSEQKKQRDKILEIIKKYKEHTE